MLTRLTLPVYLLAAVFLIGCSDDSDSRPGGGTPPPEPEPEISLDETGTYSGTLETDNGEVALMQLKLARDGTTAITLDTDDDETPDRLLWGKSDGGDGAIVFSGNDTDDGDDVSIDIQVSEGVASGRLELSGVTGGFSLPTDDFSHRPSSLQRLAGDYARGGNVEGVSRLRIAPDGSVQLTGSCLASGSITEIDAEVNLYRVKLNSDCADLDALLSLEDVDAEGDVISMAGTGRDGGLVLEYYRI